MNIEQLNKHVAAVHAMEAVRLDIKVDHEGNRPKFIISGTFNQPTFESLGMVQNGYTLSGPLILAINKINAFIIQELKPLIDEQKEEIRKLL